MFEMFLYDCLDMCIHLYLQLYFYLELCLHLVYVQKNMLYLYRCLCLCPRLCLFFCVFPELSRNFSMFCPCLSFFLQISFICVLPLSCSFVPFLFLFLASAFGSFLGAVAKSTRQRDVHEFSKTAYQQVCAAHPLETWWW